MKISSLALLFFLSGQIINAQVVQTDSGVTNELQLNTITTAVPFLMISGNPQQMASGDVGVVSSNMYHETAFTSNAALLANGQRYVSTSTNYTPWLRINTNMITVSA
ncbi:MAG: hypothetical protein JKX84_07020, partial [Flavobacteriales bacterium]|nr:hypothetical protein [Flavobacteriales bacterium]